MRAGYSRPPYSRPTSDVSDEGYSPSPRRGPSRASPSQPLSDASEQYAPPKSNGYLRPPLPRPLSGTSLISEGSIYSQMTGMPPQDTCRERISRVEEQVFDGHPGGASASEEELVLEMRSRLWLFAIPIFDLHSGYLHLPPIVYSDTHTLSTLCSPSTHPLLLLNLSAVSNIHSRSSSYDHL